MTNNIIRKMLFVLVAATAAGFYAADGGTVEAEKNNDPKQFARGAKGWAENCNRCHNMRDPKELTDWEWEVAVSHMARIGNIPRNLARDIEAFLKGSN